MHHTPCPDLIAFSIEALGMLTALARAIILSRRGFSSAPPSKNNPKKQE